MNLLPIFYKIGVILCSIRTKINRIGLLSVDFHGCTKCLQPIEGDYLDLIQASNDKIFTSTYIGKVPSDHDYKYLYKFDLESIEDALRNVSIDEIGSHFFLKFHTNKNSTNLPYYDGRPYLFLGIRLTNGHYSFDNLGNRMLLFQMLIFLQTNLKDCCRLLEYRIKIEKFDEYVILDKLKRKITLFHFTNISKGYKFVINNLDKIIRASHVLEVIPQSIKLEAKQKEYMIKVLEAMTDIYNIGQATYSLLCDGDFESKLIGLLPPCSGEIEIVNCVEFEQNGLNYKNFTLSDHAIEMKDSHGEIVDQKLLNFTLLDGKIYIRDEEMIRYNIYQISLIPHTNQCNADPMVLFNEDLRDFLEKLTLD